MGCVIKYKGQSIPEEQFLQYLNKQIAINNLFNENKTLANAVYEALGFKSKPEQNVTTNNLSKVIDSSFNNDNLQLRVGKSTDNDVETTILRNGEAVGFVTLTIKNGKVHIKITEVFDKFQKQGIAEDVYVELNRILQEQGFGELNSDVEFLKDTKTEQWTLDGKILSKEEKKKITDDIDLLIELEESGRLGKTEAVRPAIKLWEKLIRKGLAEQAENGYKFKTQTTPQQKQQAQQLYSQYLESLNKPNTNPILQGNQQEQLKKFAELQERLNNKEFLEGAKSTYESTPALQELGTQEEYNDYIARVSLGIIKNPSSGEYNYTSKVKDIVYHGTPGEKFDRFSDDFKNSNKGMNVGIWENKQQTFRNKAGVWLATNKWFAKTVFAESQGLYEGEGNTLPVIVNVNSIISKDLDKIEEKDLSNDAVKTVETVHLPDNSGGIDIFDTVYLITKSENTHILGSKQDIGGFKEFINNKQLITPQQDNIILNSKEFQSFAEKELEKNPESSIEEILEYYKKCKK